MLHLRPFDWLLLLFCMVVGIRFLMPGMQRSAYDFVIAAMVVIVALYLFADAVVR